MAQQPSSTVQPSQNMLQDAVFTILSSIIPLVAMTAA